MALNYGQVADLQDAFLSSRPSTETLPEFAQWMNEATGSEAYSAGLKENWVKKLSHGIDKGLVATGIPKASGDFFAELGKSIGYEGAARSAGEGLPRGVVNFAPMMLAGLVAPLSVPVAAAGALATGLLSGADTYTQTGSTGAGLISGAVAAAIGPVAEIGGQIALKSMGAALAKEGGLRVAGTLGEKLGEYAGGQVAALTSFELAGQAESVLQGQGLYNPLSPEHLVESAVGQLPFMAVHGVTSLLKKPTPVEKFLKTATEADDASVAAKNLASIPKLADVEVEGPLKLKSDTLLELYKQRKEFATDEALTQPQRQKAVDRLDEKITELMTGKVKVKETTEEGNPAPTQTRVGVDLKEDVVRLVGTVDNSTERSHFVTVETADAIGYAGKRVQVPKSMVRESKTVDGKLEITVPKKFVREAAWMEQEKAAPKVVDKGAGTEPLPTQPDWQQTEERMRLERVQSELDAHWESVKALEDVEVRDISDFEDVVTKTDDINKNVGNKVPTTDAELQAKVDKELEVTNGDLTEAAIRVAKKQVAAAANLVEEKEKSTKRAVKSVERSVKAGQTLADLQERVNEAKRTKKLTDLTEADLADKQDLRIVNEFMQQLGYSVEGRLINAPEEIVRAYDSWLKKPETQERLDKIEASKESSTQESRLEARKSLLAGYLKKVGENQKHGQTITGGRVLKVGEVWGSPDQQVANHPFATKEEALAYIKDKQESDPKAAMWPVVKVMGNEKRGFYLQERPREMKGSLDVAKETGSEVVATQAQADEEQHLSMDAEFDKLVGSRHVTKTEDALESLKEETGTKGEELVQAMTTKVAALDDNYVAEFLDAAELSNSTEDVQNFKARTQVLMDAIGKGEVTPRRPTDGQASRLNDLFNEKGVPFKTEAEAKEFARKQEPYILMARAMTVQEEPTGQRALTRPGPVDIRATLTPFEQKRLDTYRLNEENPIGTIEYLKKVFAGQKNLGRVVFDILDEHKDLLKNVTIAVIENVRDRAAYYDKWKDTVTINGGWLSPKVTDMSFANTLAHELLHAVTVKAMETREDHPAVKTIEVLRQKAISLLPKDIRPEFDAYVKSDEFNKFAKKETSHIKWSDNISDTMWEDVFYGLTNKAEFTAQAFSSNSMQRYLTSLKTPASKSLFRRVVTTLGEFFGFKNENLLYQTMTATTRLFDRQRTILKFEDVVKPLLRNAGVVQKNLVGRAGSIYAFLEVRPTGITVEERTANIVDRTVASFLQSKADLGLSYYELRDANTATRLEKIEDTVGAVESQLHKEFGLKGQGIDDIAGSLVQKLDNKGQQAFLEQAPLSTVYTVRALAQHGLVNLDVLSKIDDGARAGVLSITPLAQKAFETAREKFQNAKDNADKVINDNASLLKLEALEPAGFLAAMQDNAFRAHHAQPRYNGRAEMVEALNMEGPGKKIGRTFRDIFMPAWQFAMQNPVIKPVIELAFNHQAQVRRFMTETSVPFFVKNGEFSNAMAKQFEKDMKNTFITERVDRLLNLRQDQKTLLDYNDPATKKATDVILSGLTTEQRARVIEIEQAQVISTVTTQGKIVEGEKHLGTVALASILQRGSVLKTEQNRQIAQTLLDNMKLLADPVQGEQAKQAILALRANLGDELFQRAIGFASKETDRITKFEQFFADRPYFATEQNFGKFVITFKRNGVDGRVDGETLAEAREKLAKNHPGATVMREIPKQDKDNPDRSFGMSEKMLGKLQEFQDAHLAALVEAGVSREDLDSAKSNSPVEALKREMAANALYKPGSERKGALGRELLPMLHNHFNYMNAVANSLNKRITRAEMWFRSGDPDLATQPDIRQQGIKHIENYLAPDSEAGKMLSQVNFFYYLGMNLSSHLIEGGQSLVSHASQLTAEGAGVFGGYTRLLKSAAAIKDWAIGQRGTDANGRELAWKNPEHAEIMARAKLDGEIGLGMWDEAMGPIDQATINSMRLSNGNPTLSASELVKRPLMAYKYVAASVYSVFTHFNARVALLSSFDLYRSKGFSVDDAYQKAREFNRTVNFSGGRAARPIDLFNSRGNMRTASMAINSLQSYQSGMISMFYRLVSQGFGGATEGLTAVDRGNARKAAVQLFATQLTAAGVLGMPGVAVGVALLEQLFPDLELKKNMREIAHRVLDDDKETGGLLSNIALQGIPSQLGVDVQSRLGIGGNIAGLSEYNGYDPANILGPSYNILRNMAVGVQKTAMGDLGAGVQQVLPPAFRKLMDLARSGGELRSPSGQLLIQPTMGEKVAYGIGFKPKRIADAQEAEHLLRRSSEIRRREVEQFHGKTAEQFLSGDVKGAQRSILERADKDPTFDVRAGARAVASAVEQRTMPDDLRRGGTRSTGDDRQQLLQTYRNLQQTPSELQRLSLRRRVETMLGLPGAGQVSPTELHVASLVDSLMSADSSLSRSQARQKAERLVFGSVVRGLGATSSGQDE